MDLGRACPSATVKGTRGCGKTLFDEPPTKTRTSPKGLKMSNLAHYRPLHTSSFGGGHHEGAISRFLAHNPIISRARSMLHLDIPSPRERAIAGGQILRQGIEGAVTGGVLAFAHAELPRGGLDRQIGKHVIPLDGVVAGAGFLGSWLTAGHEVSGDFRNTAVSALTVLAFRKMFAFAAQQKLHSGGAVGGSFGPAAAGAPRPLAAHGDEDPIVRFARGM